MQILIVDDYSIKANWIMKEIMENYPNAKFFLCSCGEDGISVLEKEKIDFIVLDMQLPYEKGGSIDNECCVKVLKEMKKRGFGSIKTCICSSGGKWISELDAFDNVLSFVRYEDRNAADKFANIIK